MWPPGGAVRAGVDVPQASERVGGRARAQGGGGEGEEVLLFLLDEPAQDDHHHAQLPRGKLLAGRQPLRPEAVRVQHPLAVAVPPGGPRGGGGRVRGVNK
eukprot:1189326-Prorocentrum_minimum.AAC.2